MKRLIFALLLAFHFSCAFAGDELDRLKKDISNYLLEQNKTPNQIIRYSDGNGSIARAVLNPDRAKRFIDEIRKESDYPEKLRAVLEQYKPISQNYMAAFDQSPGQYDAEYLDHFDFLFQLMVANATPLQNVNLDAIKDEGVRTMVQASAKMIQAMPSLFLVALEKQIKDKKFSATFTPQAIAKLNQLREIQAQALQIGASPTAKASDGSCAIMVSQAGKVLQSSQSGRVRIYDLVDSPFRFEVTSAQCNPSIGVFLSTQDFQYVADSPVVVTTTGFSMAGSDDTKDVLFFRSENPRLVNGFENIFDSNKKEYEALCIEFGKCPQKIRAYRTYWNFLGAGGRETRTFADFKRLSMGKPIKGYRGAIPVIVYTKIKDIANDSISVMGTHPIVLRFK